MKIFIDSADYNEILKAYEWGVVDGITTNPSLLKKAVDIRKVNGEKLDLDKYIIKILELAKGDPVSLEVTATDTDEIVKQGIKLYKKYNPVASNVYIKVPINTAFSKDDKKHFEGLKAIQVLSSKNIPVNCTLIFTPEQALLAAKAGAAFVSPFAGRVDDDLRKSLSRDFSKNEYYPAIGLKNDNDYINDNGIYSGIDLVGKCVEILKYYTYDTEILAASLRNPRQVREAALCGVDIATLPYSVIEQMLKHHKTFEGMQKFTNDIVDEYTDLLK